MSLSYALRNSDYTPLIWRLRSGGHKVLGIGRPTTPLALGTFLKQRTVQFNPTMDGYKDLFTFIKAHSDSFETRRRASKGKPVQVRRRHIPSPEQPILSHSSGKATTSPAHKTRKKAAPPCADHEQ